MSLRDDLKNFIPKFLWDSINHPQGYVVSAEEYNAHWNLNVEQGDHTSKTLEELLDMLYQTVLNDTEGAEHVFTQVPGVAATNVRAALLELKTNITSLEDWRVIINQAIDVLENSDVTLGQAINGVMNALTTHTSSSDHDGRYYTKTLANAQFVSRSELDTTANVLVKTEVFRIVDPDLGDGTFSYTDKNNDLKIGSLQGGYQVFTLQEGDYSLGENRLSAIINDTLHRSAASGGLTEVDSTRVGVIAEIGGTEITISYFTITGSVGSGIVVGSIQPTTVYQGKLWVDTGGA